MSTNVIEIKDPQGKREAYKRSARSKKYVTIIYQDFFQKSNLSLEAMGLIGYLISLPDDWVVYNHHLQNTFNIGRDKLRKILKELSGAGYMRRTARQNGNGKMVGWITEYSDAPEFLDENRVTEKPSVGLADRRKKTSYKINKETILNNNTTKAIAKPAPHIEPQAMFQAKPKPDSNLNQKPDEKTIESTVVVALMEKLKGIAIAEVLVKSWLKKYGAEYVEEKVNYTLSAACNNPAGFLNRALAENWTGPMPKDVKEVKAAVEVVYPSHDENLAWYVSLSDKEKRKCYGHAISKHAHFESMLKSEGIDILSAEFLKTTWFAMMMELIGRAK